MDAFSARDELLVNDVQKMAELGKFATEFVFYGCAFYENGEVWAAVSENRAEVSEFIYDTKNISKMPTQVKTLRYVTKVAGGMKEKIVQEQKRVLASQLLAEYPLKYFLILADVWANVQRKDDAYDLLLKQAYELDGVCDSDGLQLFQGLLELAYSKRLISEKHYQELWEWVLWEKRDLLQIPRKKDKYHQEFYGFAYILDEEIKVCIDGSKDNIYSKWEQLAQATFISPIAKKMCWYNNNYGVKEAREDCLKYFHKLFSLEYMNRLRQLKAMKCEIDINRWEKCKKQIFDLKSETLNKELGRIMFLYEM